MTKKITALGLIFSVIFLFVVGTSAAQRPDRPESPLIKWLLKMQVPNDIVPNPANGRSGLVLSYLVPQHITTRAAQYDRAYIYDNALAVISFVLNGKFEEEI